MKLAQIDIGETFLGPNSEFKELTGVGSLVSRTVTIALTAAGIILLFLLIVGGLMMIAGAGSDNPETVEKGKKAASSAIIGFVVVFVAYWIIRIIELITGFNFITGL